MSKYGPGSLVECFIDDKIYKGIVRVFLGNKKYYVSIYDKQLVLKGYLILKTHKMKLADKSKWIEEQYEYQRNRYRKINSIS